MQDLFVLFLADDDFDGARTVAYQASLRGRQDLRHDLNRIDGSAGGGTEQGLGKLEYLTLAECVAAQPGSFGLRDARQVRGADCLARKQHAATAFHVASQCVAVRIGQYSGVFQQQQAAADVARFQAAVGNRLRAEVQPAEALAGSQQRRVLAGKGGRTGGALRVMGRGAVEQRDVGQPAAAQAPPLPGTQERAHHAGHHLIALGHQPSLRRRVIPGEVAPAMGQDNRHFLLQLHSGLAGGTARIPGEDGGHQVERPGMAVVPDGVGCKIVNLAAVIAGEIVDARRRFLGHAERECPVDRHQALGVATLDAGGGLGAELAVDLPLHFLVGLPPGLLGSGWRVEPVLLAEPRAALGAVAVHHREAGAVEPEAAGPVAVDDLVDHRPQVLFGHTRVVAQHVVVGVAASADAVPLGVPAHDFPVAPEIEVGRERATARAGDFGPDLHHVSGQLGRRVADPRWVSRPAGVTLGVDLDHVGLHQPDESRGLDRVGIASDLHPVGGVMVEVQQEEAPGIPVLLRSIRSQRGITARQRDGQNRGEHHPLVHRIHGVNSGWRFHLLSLCCHRLPTFACLASSRLPR